MYIWVGFEKVTPYKLGFEYYYSMPIHPSEYKPLWLHVFRRHGETLAIISTHQYVRVSDFVNSVTRYLDYPTLPFLRILEMLERQQEQFMEKIAAAFRNRTHPCCSAIEYIADVAALLRFALQRRGVDVDVFIDCTGRLSKEELRKVAKAVREAWEPAPSLGNSTYAEIAERAFQILVVATRLIELLPVKNGCSCTC